MRTCLSQTISFILLWKSRRNTRIGAHGRPQFLLHACETPQMLQNNNALALCANGSLVCRLLHWPPSAHRWKSKAYRRLCLRDETILKVPEFTATVGCLWVQRVLVGMLTSEGRQCRFHTSNSSGPC